MQLGKCGPKACQASGFRMRKPTFPQISETKETLDYLLGKTSSSETELRRGRGKRRRPGETRPSSKEHPPNPHLNFKKCSSRKRTQSTKWDGWVFGRVKPSSSETELQKGQSQKKKKTC
ncbi:hypothetical protein CEXT_192791 [Caerostris extrusa]|uniref:Uncharacterized protein n=1 Tax=Caerostris extrusa TaxID=172846 RepID=A0AAV4XV08_CAEEX|nr:hypothetical protein CEXT_192791 [Caerostris extrusa]